MEKFEKPENFTELGFVIIRNLLSPDEVEKLRLFVHEKVALHGHKRMIFNYQAYQYPEVYLPPFKREAVKMLKQVLGENLCYYADLVVQYNMFGYPGWHTDSGSEGEAKYLMAPNYKFAKCGIYLQDNTLEWGGGITVIPKGHKPLLLTGNSKIDWIMKVLTFRGSINYSFPRKPMRVDTKAGDMVFFDSRLPHTSAPSENISKMNIDAGAHVKGIPKENSKIVLYWNASNMEMRDDFLTNAAKRAATEGREDELFMTSMVKYHFPDDFPDDFVAKAKECGVEIACWDKQRCQEMKQRFEEFNVGGLA